MTRVHAAATALLLTLGLAGCASAPPDRFYSLSTGLGQGAAPAPAAGYYIEVPAVTVPQQVARNQLVVTLDGGRVDLLEQERWSQQPAAEIQQALSLAITSALGTVDVFRTPAPEQATVYRISTNVQRFESAPGQYALLDAVWSVRKVGSTSVLTCRSVAQESVSPGYDQLVAGHRRAVARIAADISSAVRALAAGQPGTCH